MDLALVRINEREKKVEFAGARNALLVAYPDSFETFEAEDFSIGEDLIRHRNNRKPKFTNHKIQYTPGMILYMSSDGYKDQFGGEDRKKFGAKRLKEMLSENQELDMKDQKRIIMSSFSKWMGAEDQVDDVLVMGVKL